MPVPQRGYYREPVQRHFQCDGRHVLFGVTTHSCVPSEVERGKLASPIILQLVYHPVMLMGLQYSKSQQFVDQSAGTVVSPSPSISRSSSCLLRLLRTQGHREGGAGVGAWRQYWAQIYGSRKAFAVIHAHVMDAPIVLQDNLQGPVSESPGVVARRVRVCPRFARQCLEVCDINSVFRR